MTKKKFLFLGPSSYGINIKTSDDITLLPPAKRDDIKQIINENTEPGIILLVDGTFHSYPSVSHTEIRDALNLGWTVFGLCSMGAIRACEMASYGMIPWGLVSKSFVDDDLFADDEVALIHGIDTPYYPMSEPLIHIREYLLFQVNYYRLTQSEHDKILHEIQNCWYGYRTLNKLKKLIKTYVSDNIKKNIMIRDLLDFDKYRIKQIDLKRFINEKPWILYE